MGILNPKCCVPVDVENVPEFVRLSHSQNAGTLKMLNKTFGLCDWGVYETRGVCV